MSKNSFKFCGEWFMAIQSMNTKKEQLASFNAICRYALEGITPEETNPFLQLVFMQISKNKSISEKRSASGSQHAGNQYTTKTEMEQNGTSWNKMEQVGTKFCKEEKENQEKESSPSVLPYKEKEIKEKEEKASLQKTESSKVKKERLSLDAVKALDFGDWQELIQDWVEYRIKQHGFSFTEIGLKAFVTRIKKISSNQPEKAKEMMLYSMGNGWMDVYEPKGSNNATSDAVHIQQTHKQDFNNW